MEKPGLDLGASLTESAQRAFSSADAAMARYQARMREEAPRIERRSREIDELMAGMPVHTAAAPPKAPAAAPKPEAPSTDALAAFGSTAVLLGIFGSALLGQPIETALNSASAAMEARKKADWTEYARRYSEWKEASELAWKQASWEASRYQGAIELAKTDSNLALAKVQGLAAATENDKMALLAETGDWKSIAEYAGSMAKASEALETRALRVQLMAANMDKTRFTAPQMVAVPGRPEPVLAQQDKVTHRWYTADEHMNPVPAVTSVIPPATASATVAKKEATTALRSNLEKSIDELQNEIDADPHVIGLLGKAAKAGVKVSDLQRSLGPFTGPNLLALTAALGIPGASEAEVRELAKRATEFETRVRALQANLAQPFLHAKYFSGPIAARLDQLVQGLALLDSPTTVGANLSALKGLIRQQMGSGDTAGEPGLVPGTAVSGYIFLGGDPADQGNWVEQTGQQ